MNILILASLALLLAAFFLRYFARARAAALGLPGELVYADQGEQELFVSDRHGLVGRPDYIREVDGGELVPVERKSRELKASGPYEGEILQLAAYALLVEERFERPVRRGQLQYLNRSVEIAFDEQLRTRLMSALDALGQASQLPDVPRSHNSAARCRACGYRSKCSQSLD